MTDRLKIVRICARNVPRTGTQAPRRRCVSRISLSLSLQKSDGVACWCAGVPSCWNTKQELNYRKQIARQLRTQFVEGISVTLKSTLRVIQCHWKRKQWTDHTGLTIRRVIGRWILSWAWNVGQRSLKAIESATIWKFGYGFLTFPTLTLTLGLGVKVIENGAVR